MSIYAGTDLTVIQCSACGIAFAMPSVLCNARRANSGAFFCPNGHQLQFAKPPAVVAATDKTKQTPGSNGRLHLDN